MIKEAIIKIVNKGDLTYQEAETVMNEIMNGETTPTQNAAFLAALSTKSTKAETIDEITGCAVAMRSHATPVPHEGIICAIESAHAVAHARKIAPLMRPDQSIIICLSGRGDKDVAAIARYRGIALEE